MKKAIIPAILVLITGYINAQQAFSNQGNLQIHSGASISGFGNFTNATSAALVNNGTFYIQGNLTNDQSSMTAGTGTLHMNGSVAQILNGSQPFRTFHFVSNNSAGITLSNNLHISSTHTFTSGVITTSTTPNYLVYEAGSSYTGDGDTRHVNGWVKKSGNTDFVFPVGNGTIERTIRMHNLSANSEFNARYLENTPNNNSVQSPGVWDVNNLEYWAVNRVSGGTASLTLNWDYNKVWFPNWVVADILVAGYNGSQWFDNGGAGTATGSTTSTGTVTSGTISSFNLFTHGSRTYFLPVTLLSFTAIRQNNYTQINWITEKEYNLDHYIIERSDNGVDFYTIGQTSARNSVGIEHYSGTDNHLINNVAYYRLKCVDKDGKHKFTKIVTITVNDTSELALLTNPVRNNILLTATTQLSGKFNYQLNSMNGQLVQQGQLIIQHAGQYQIALNKSLPAGTYSLRVSNEQQAFHYKLTIQ